MLTPPRLKHLMTYDPITGKFTRNVSVRGQPIGKVAGSINSAGYISIGVDMKRYTAHRLAWLYMTGVWPKDQIDHKDGNRTNNAWKNLREATQSQNIAARPYKPDASGTRGVDRAGKKWRAVITVNSERIYLGLFNYLIDAQNAYKEAATKYFGEFAPK